MLAQRLRSPLFKSLPRHSVVEVNCSFLHLAPAAHISIMLPSDRERSAQQKQTYDQLHYVYALKSYIVTSFTLIYKTDKEQIYQRFFDLTNWFFDSLLVYQNVHLVVTTFEV